MQKNRFQLLLTVGVVCGFMIAPARSQTGVAKAPGSLLELLQDGERRLEDGRTLLDEGLLTDARRVFEECTHRDGEKSLCYFDLGLTESYLFHVKDFQKEKKAAEHWLDLAIGDTRQSIALDERRADAHALLADLYGNKIGYAGMMGGMRYGPKAEAETRRALELDAKNARAYQVLGRRHLYSPKMFGGDIDKAIESFRKSTELDPQRDEAFVWLAIAYRKKGDKTQAQDALAQALRLNGRSAFAKRVQSGAD
jgi:tetratricopeptide (TPR) repeat protein